VPTANFRSSGSTNTSTDVRLNANGKHPNSARLSSVSREVPTASYIRSANPYDFGVIIRKPVFELVVKPDLGLFPPPKHAQLRGDRLQFLARVLVPAAGPSTGMVVIAMVEFGEMTP